MLAYHFTGPTLRDGQPMPPRGAWLEHDGPLIPCERGLHASRDPFDALNYAPGVLLHRVEIDGAFVEHGTPPDKLCAQRRRILATIDATALLREFSRWCALQAIHLWDAPKIAQDYLITGEERRRDAAYAAAKTAASTAVAGGRAIVAVDAAWSTGWAAADRTTVVCVASRGAAMYAASAVAADVVDAEDINAWTAALAAALAAQREQFRQLVEAAFSMIEAAG